MIVLFCDKYLPFSSFDFCGRNLKVHFDKFIQSYSLIWIQKVLSGLRDTKKFDLVDWDRDELFLRFKDWVVGNEE